MASYKAEIEVVAKGLKGINDLNAAVSKLNSTVSGSRQSQNLADKRTAAMVRLRNVGDQVRKLEEEGVVLGKAQLQIKKAAEALDKGNLATVKARVGIAREEVKEARQELRLEQKITQELQKQQKTAGAGAGGGGRRGGGRGGRFQDIATGAGFPLLFGGGPAQALAGGIGGAFGGLGGSIAASAAVSQFEAFAQAATATGQALNSTGGALDLVREKSLFSKAGNEELAAQLEEQGDVAGLAALLTEELVDKIGNNGVQALQDLGTETDETTRLWNELTLQLQALIAGPLTDFLKIVNQFLGEQGNRARLAALQKDLAGTEAGGQLAADIERLRPTSQVLRQGETRTIPGVLAPSDVEALLEKFTPERPPSTVRIPQTAADQRRFAVKDTAGDKTAREAERVKQRIDALRREREEIIAISGIKDKIALAEAANDSQLVIRLQGQQRLRQIETERLNDLAKAKTAEEARAINQTAVVKALAAQLETGRQLTEDQRQRQELFETTIEGLEHQLEMTEATSQAERDRLKIAREMKKLKDKGLTDDQVAQAGGIMERLAIAQQPLNAFIRKTTEDLNNLQQVAVDVSQGIGNAIGSSLVNGLQSLVTGAASIKEVFANMLKSVADVLANTAAKMIAQYIAIGIARMFAGMSGGGGSQSSPPAPTPPTTLPGSVGLVAAEGAFVTGPTRALIGEGGEPEYIIPESKMRESMSRYSRGARGSSVIPETGSPEASGEGGGTAVAAPIDVRYSVERINSVDYVTADQFQAGMRQAATQGAKQGEQQTLRRLQMSGSTRKRVGM